MSIRRSKRVGRRTSRNLLPHLRAPAFTVATRRPPRTPGCRARAQFGDLFEQPVLGVGAGTSAGPRPARRSAAWVELAPAPLAVSGRSTGTFVHLRGAHAVLGQCGGLVFEDLGWGRSHEPSRPNQSSGRRGSDPSEAGITIWRDACGRGIGEERVEACARPGIARMCGRSRRLGVGGPTRSAIDSSSMRSHIPVPAPSTRIRAYESRDQRVGVVGLPGAGGGHQRRRSTPHSSRCPQGVVVGRSVLISVWLGSVAG